MTVRDATRLVLMACLVGSCAVPVPPAGGPIDREPPAVLGTEPENGAVLVRPDRVRIRFAEYIDAASAASAVSVTPEGARPPEIRPRGKGIDIVFRDSLRSRTTYIVTLDTGLKDANGVALAAPITIAFATGPQIDRGRLSGRVRAWEDGRPAKGMDVYAYPAAESEGPELPARPAFRTQTDQEGRFRFDHLAEDDFFVMAVADRNQNRRADPGERTALPPSARVRADTVGASSGLWLASTVDVAGPEIRRVSAVSATRVALRFSEPVTLVDRDPAAWRIADSLGAVFVPVTDAFQRSAERDAVYLRTDPLPGGRLFVSARAAVADTAFNAASVPAFAFDAVTDPDTASVRFLGFAADTLGVQTGAWVLAPDAMPGLRFSDPPGPLDGLVSVVRADSTVEPPGALMTADGTTVRVRTNAARYRLVLGLAPFGHPDSSASQAFRAADPALLGEIGATIAADSLPVFVDVAAGKRSVRFATDAAGRLLAARIPAGSGYRLRYFEDRNGNGRWDAGTRYPFVPAERIGWVDTVPPVRARWETAIPDTLRFASERAGNE